MKKLFEWVKASPDNLPEIEDRNRLSVLYKGCPEVLVFIDGEWYWFDSDSISESMKYLVRKDSWRAIEFLSPVEQEPVDEDEMWAELFAHTRLINDNRVANIQKLKLIQKLKQSFIIKRKP